VVLTAPIPGNKIPSFPLAGSIFRGLSITLLQRRSVHAGLSIQAYQCRPIDAANPGVHDNVSTAYKQPLKIGLIPHKRTSNDARTIHDLQIVAGDLNEKIFRQS
jgi:hypothetical protein